MRSSAACRADRAESRLLDRHRAQRPERNGNWPSGAELRVGAASDLGCARGTPLKHPYCVYSQSNNVDAQRQCVVAHRRRVVRQLMQDKTAPAAATTASRCADEVRIAQVSLEPISWTRMHNAQSYVGTMGSGWGEGTATPSCSSANVFSRASGRDLLCAYRSPYRAPSDRRSAARNYCVATAQLIDLPADVSRSGAVPARA